MPATITISDEDMEKGVCIYITYQDGQHHLKVATDGKSAQRDRLFVVQWLETLHALRALHYVLPPEETPVVLP